MYKTKQKKRERGLGLMIFLIIQILAFLLGIAAIVILLPELNSYARITGESLFSLQLTMYSSIAILIFGIVCTIGIWMWRIWGYWGLMITYILSVLVGIVSGQPGQIFVNLFWFGLFYMATRKKVHFMDWKF